MPWVCDCDRRTMPAQTVLAANAGTEILSDSRSSYNGLSLHWSWNVIVFKDMFTKGLPYSRPSVSENCKVALWRDCTQYLEALKCSRLIGGIISCLISFWKCELGLLGVTKLKTPQHTIPNVLAWLSILTKCSRQCFAREFPSLEPNWIMASWQTGFLQ